MVDETDETSTGTELVTTIQCDVELKIKHLIKERKLKWMEDTDEFKQGLLIGLEIAGIYGDAIHKMYNSSS